MKNSLTEMILTSEEIQQAIARAKLMELNRISFSLNKRHVEKTMDDVKIDEDEVIRIANNLKIHDLMMQEKRTKYEAAKLEHRKYLEEKFTPEGMFLFAKQLFSARFPDQKFDYIPGENREAIRAVIYFLTKDHRFATESGKYFGREFSLEKGLWIRGKLGVGKSFIFELLQSNPLNPFVLTDMYTIENQVKNTGAYNVNLDQLTYFDDIGTEEIPIQFFKASIYWFQKFILHAYRSPAKWKNIMFSTNLNRETMELTYGERASDRMNQMFNIIDFKGESKRLKK